MNYCKLKATQILFSSNNMILYHFVKIYGY